jgi:hydroxypyruvate reductase
VIATANHALAAAQAVGEASGWQVTNLGAYIEGEAREVGRVHAGIARELADVAARTAKPQLLISGGETTVTVKHPNPGRGGRNGEFLLSAMLANTVPNLHALAVDTDGIDGVESNAGAQFSPQTLAQIGKAKAHEHLQRNDAFTCFELGGGLITTGPTRTNVNDFRAFAISV